MKLSLLNICLIIIGLSACASTPSSMIPELDEGNTAPGAAYTADSMNFRKNMPKGQRRDFDFFYKHCAMNNDKAYRVTNSYDCAGPAY